jgi:hypothetical protein
MLTFLLESRVGNIFAVKFWLFCTHVAPTFWRAPSYLSTPEGHPRASGGAAIGPWTQKNKINGHLHDTIVVL